MSSIFPNAHRRSRVPEYLLSLALGLGVFASMATADEARVPVRFDAEGRPVVSARINAGAEFDFMVDTAAQRSGIGAPVIDALSLEPAPDMQAQIAGVAGHRTVPMYALDTFELAGRVVEDGYYYSLTGDFDAGGHSHDGIVGQDVFARGQIVFDWGRQTVGFGPEQGAGLGEAIPAQVMYGGFFLIPVRINGVDATALVDTGAAESFANPELLEALPPSADSVETTRERMGVSQHEIDRVEGRQADVSIGSVTLAARPMTIIDSPVFVTFGLTEAPALVLGMDRLIELQGFALDYDAGAFRHLE